MGLNVSTTMGFENKDAMQNTAKAILNKSGATKEQASKLVENTTLFDNYGSNYSSAALVLKTSTQISVNSSLRETLKYLREHAYKKNIKTPVFGELWNQMENSNSDRDSDQYSGELYDLQIDTNITNIFAA